MLPLQPDDLLTMMLGQSSPGRLYSHQLYKIVELDRYQPRGLDRIIHFLKTIIGTPRLASRVRELHLADWTQCFYKKTFHVDQTAATVRLRAEYQKSGRVDVEVGQDYFGQFLVSNLPNLRKLMWKCGNQSDMITGAFLPNVIHVGTKYSENIQKYPHIAIWRSPFY